MNPLYERIGRNIPRDNEVAAALENGERPLPNFTGISRFFTSILELLLTFVISLIPFWDIDLYIKVVYHSWFKEGIKKLHPAPVEEEEDDGEDATNQENNGGEAQNLNQNREAGAQEVQANAEGEENPVQAEEQAVIQEEPTSSNDGADNKTEIQPRNEANRELVRELVDDLEGPIIRRVENRDPLQEQNKAEPNVNEQNEEEKSKPEKIETQNPVPEIIEESKPDQKVDDAAPPEVVAPLPQTLTPPQNENEEKEEPDEHSDESEDSSDEKDPFAKLSGGARLSDLIQDSTNRDTKPEDKNNEE